MGVISMSGFIKDPQKKKRGPATTDVRSTRYAHVCTYRNLQAELSNAPKVLVRKHPVHSPALQPHEDFEPAVFEPR